jgi:peptide chain release factor 1
MGRPAQAAFLCDLKELMLDRLNKVEERYEELTRLMADPEVAQDYERVAEYAKERADLEDIVGVYQAYKDTATELEATQTLLADDADPELQELAEVEIAQLEARLSELEAQLHRMLLPQDPRDTRNVIVEIRAGAGGDEAGLFAADLYRMYNRYAERQNWKTELISGHSTGVGGFKEVVFGVQGRVRKRRPSCAAHTDHRVLRAHPHLHRHRSRLARGGRRGDSN